MANTFKQGRFWKIFRRILKITGIFLLVLTVIFGAWYVWATYPRDTTEIREVASRFQLSPEWQMTKDSVHSSAPLCGAWIYGRCPSVDRTWTSNQPITFLDLKSAVTSAGYEIIHVEQPANFLDGGYCESGCGFVATFSAKKEYELLIRYYDSNITPTPVINMEVTLE